MTEKTDFTDLAPVESATDGDYKQFAAGDVDAAFQFIHNAHSVDTSINERKFIRKIDFMLMPLMFMCYYLQYTDKTLLSYAAVMGIIDDTHIPSGGFSHLAIAFYVSFIVCEPIQSFLIQKFPTAKYLGCNVILWGIVVTMNCVCHNFASVVALRVLLGVFESSVAPSLIILTGMWYTRQEQVVRMGIWYQGTSVAPAISSLVSYGFLKYTNSHPDAHFKSWQIVYLLFGLITVATGILVVLFLPDNPMSSRLSDSEKRYAIERIRDNQTGIKNNRIKWKQVKEALSDPKTWLLSLIVISTNIPNGAVSSFSSIIISNFGYSDSETLLLNLPSAAVAFISVWLACWFSSSTQGRRGISAICLIVPTLLGGALMAWLPADNKAGLLAGNFLTNTVGASLPLFYSWSSANYAGNTKKSTMNAIILMSFCIGNIIGPETFRANDAPQYIPAKITIVAVLSFAILCVIALDSMYMLENRKRDKEAQALGEQGIVMPADFEFLDLTDGENKKFRYLL